MAHRVLSTPSDVLAFARFLLTFKLPLTIQWRQGRDRSLDQNALVWKWAAEVAAQRGDTRSDEVQHDWKLRHGVPILRAEDEDFRAFYDSALKGRPFEEKVKAMVYVPVTSTMTVKQMSRFMDAVQQECAEQGFRLTDPEMMEAA